ncbi:MAG: V-type ATP synthase subunit I [Gammaproteobacteria bacterium]
MSIVRLKKATLVGLLPDRDSLLENLQGMGCMQVIPLQSAEEDSERCGLGENAEEALKFLRDCSPRRRQIRDPERFDAAEVERQVLEVRERLQNLEEERDFLIKRIRDLRAWGDFEFAPLNEMGNWRLWFYVVPHPDLAQFQATPYFQEIVKRDSRFNYIAVVAETEPEDMPVPRVHLGAKPRHELVRRLDDVELAIEDTQAERAYLTRWYRLFRQNINTLKDCAALTNTRNQLLHQAPLFALQGWIPEEKVPHLADYAENQGLCLQVEEPVPEDSPPTLLDNPPWLRAGEDLVNFYMTPGYRTWDPSATIFISFAIFFAMILADAGYAAVLGLVLAGYWKKMGRSGAGRRYRPLCAALVGVSLLYGVLIGGYFGVAPPADSLRAKLHLIDMADTNLMMAISVLVGCIHVILASALDAWRYPHWIEALASIGWALIVSGGLALVLESSFSLPLPYTIPIGLASTGAILVFFYSAPFEKPLKRTLKGLLGLTGLSGAFGDVLSYLRLFALGLASGSLATEFNRMATGILETIPGIGLLFALLILILGHGVNLLLGLASAVIHGMRLNVIEFLKWGLKEEGSLFKPLKRSGR